MTPDPVQPASLPPADLPGLDPAWSRLVDAVDADGVTRRWHVLDTGGPAPGIPAAAPSRGSILCVHGNPTWAYLWRALLARPPAGWRVVAVDQLGMGWSERPEAGRTLEQRIADLDGLVRALGVDGPVVTVAHDWGGPVSLGWALAHRDRLRGVVLANTAVHQPEGAAAPSLIRLARAPALRESVCARTSTFVRATTALSRPALPRAVRDAFAAPYRDASRRRAVADFVADIPLGSDHPSAAALDGVAKGVRTLDVPALLLWGPRDPVFSDRYLRDLLDRLPHADVHRYEAASHLVTEDAPEAFDALRTWVEDLDRAPSGEPRPDPGRHPALWAALAARAGDSSPAVVEVSGRTVSWDLLARRVGEVAAGLAAAGVRPGDRVALLVPPGADLTVALYACWRAGAVVVVADAGLGVGAMGRALRGAGPSWVIGTAQGLAAARAMRVPGRRVVAGALDSGTRRLLGAATSLADLARAGRGRALPPEPGASDECAVVFTSGATGPAKGVVYRHGQVGAQVAALRAAYRITADDRLVAAFAPFALYGPALGIASSVPATDVTAPATLTADALAEAVAAVGATLVFASPAALGNVVATAVASGAAERDKALAGVRLVMSAGAPVPVDLLRAVRQVLPSAEPHTPYGMTEALPVADVSLEELEEAGPGDGVCVGRPVPGVDVRISAVDPHGAATGPLTGHPGVVGEICVRAAHVKDRYDRLWATERLSGRDRGWHRTGDVGHLDDRGRLWVGGRLVHVVTTAGAVVTPVGVEQAVERLPGVRAAAAVGVGPEGAQQLVVVVVPEPGTGGRGVLAGAELTSAVRGAVGPPVAAVLLSDTLPVDIRHNAKVDRTRVASWAGRVLAGERVPRLRSRARTRRPGVARTRGRRP